MVLNEMENVEFINAHLATPLGLAFSQAIVNQDFDAALKSILTYFKYGGMPHNLASGTWSADRPEYCELLRLLEFYSRSPDDKDGSPNSDASTAAIVQCIYNILLNAPNGEVTSDLFHYYTEAKNEIKNSDIQLNLNL